VLAEVAVGDRARLWERPEAGRTMHAMVRDKQRGILRVHLVPEEDGTDTTPVAQVEQAEPRIPHDHLSPAAG
jgi:hypothetical protein